MNHPQELPFHPVLSAWFLESFGQPTDVQIRAWQSIGENRHTLIAAPTGSGKTLAALLPCLHQLVLHFGGAATEASAPIKRGVRILYITPLKALNNDIHHHAQRFVEALSSRAAAEGCDWPRIRCEVRTGDTSASKRASMLRHPPEMLITTPESLFLLLTSDKGSAMLETVQQVIVDEIHDLAADKRGAHLSLSLERLAARCEKPPQRIGVSATQKPLSRVARFLGGWTWEAAPLEHAQQASGTLHSVERPVSIVESAMEKRIRIAVTMPDQSVAAANREAVWKPLLDRIMQAMEGCRSVLLFVNSRRLCERLCLRLNDHVGYEMARSHHGSISRERRLEVEEMMKTGSLRCIVATSSLELGIDIGHIDLVLQIDSPQEAARGIQRIGRAGHAVGEDSRGLLIARQQALLPEMAVLSRLIGMREIEEIHIPQWPMDVLSQQIVAMVSMADWPVERLHSFICQSDSFHGYPLERLRSMLQVLTGFYPFFKPLLDWDRGTDRLQKRSNSRMASVTGAGTIPQSGGYPVHHLESRAHLGELDEEFIQESRVGDVFQLGTSSWMIREIKNDRVYVAEAGNRFSEVPFWRNEAGSRSYSLGNRIGAFWREAAERLGLLAHEAGLRAGGDPDMEWEADEAAIAWLDAEYGMEREAASALVSLIRAQHRACDLPTDRQMVVEHYQDVMNQTHVILHNHCGRRVNRAWLLAIERQFELTLPYKVYGNAKDNGIEFVLPDWDASWLQILYQVTAANLEQVLTEAVTGSPLLAVAFRKIAETSLLLSRSFTRTPMWQKRLRSEALLRNALPYAEHFPYLREAMSECLQDYLGYDELKRLLNELSAGSRVFVVRETPYPSPLAAQFVADYVNMRVYEGDGLDEATRLQLMQVSKSLVGGLFGAEQLGEAIDRGVMQSEEARLHSPALQPETKEELLVLLKERGDLTAAEIEKLAGPSSLLWLRELDEAQLVVPLDLAGDGEYRWIRAEERAIYESFPTAPASISFILGRYANHRLSFTEADLCERYPVMDLAAARRTVEQLLDQSLIVHAPHAVSETERLWTSANVAARLVRLSIHEARTRSEPVDPMRWCGQVAWMQHALSGTQQQGSEGLLTVIERLQGLFLPLSHWETIIFPARVTGYRKEELDLLCASGEVLWLGRKEEGEKEGKLAFFLAGSKSLLEPFVSVPQAQATKHPELLDLLITGGASFLTKLSRETHTPPSELFPALLDLVWEGRVSNDQFAPLRLHAASKRNNPAQWARAGSGLGRWYAVQTLAAATDPRVAGDVPREEGQDSPVLVWIHHLVQAYGMVNRELVGRVAPYDWDTYYPVLKQLEEWGVMTRGTFIQGMSTLQFTTRALSDTVRQPLPSVSQALTVLSSADPANPFGVLVDWPQGHQGAAFQRKPGNFLLLQGDKWMYWMENSGKRIFSMASAAETALREEDQVKQLQTAFQTIIRRQKLVKLSIDQWDGQAVTDTAAGQVLLHHGAERNLHSLVLWLK